MQGKHKTTKSVNSTTYNRQWSGVSYTPAIQGIKCETCGGHLHKEGHDSKYCPYCDDFKRGIKGIPEH